jgi:hypothetical protein
MEGILNERQRMNLPAGMSELDLLTYSPTLYELYRNEGNGMDKDGFRFDPVVASGILASDINYGSNMAWVNYMTPESLASLNPGDNLVVPVNTFDNYKQLPPWEKRLSHEVSYTGNKQKNKKNSRMNSNSHFTGDFNNYFDNESRALGAVVEDTAVPTSPVTPPMESITLTPSLAPPPTRGTSEVIPTRGTTITPNEPITAPASGPRSIPPPTNIVNKPADMNCEALRTTYGINPGYSYGTAPQDAIDAWNAKDCSGQYIIPRPMSPVAIALLNPPTEDPNAGIVVEVPTEGEMPMGGGSFGGGGGGGAEMPSEEQPTDSGAGAKSVISMRNECKFNFIPIIIGAVIGLIISYFIAKKKEKDVKQFGLIGLIIGAILGYAYAKHQCKPISALSKVGIPSKSLQTNSSYYGGR